jgi:asparagine synthase (glutamine-hydrolysing)
MACSVEVRVPFLDHEVAEWCLAMPPRLKRAWREKRVLRRALARELPREILERTKRGLGGPSAAWFRGAPAPRFVDELLSPESLRTKGWFDPERIRRAREIDRSGGTDRRGGLQGVLNVQIWDELFVRGRSPEDFDMEPVR